MCLQIEFQNVDVLEMLEVCQQLVMPTLQSYCLDNLSRSLDAKSACSLLKRHQEAGPGTPTSLSVIDVCMKYVERRTKEVFMTEAFLDLPKNTLLNIVKNDKVSKKAKNDIELGCPPVSKLSCIPL